MATVDELIEAGRLDDAIATQIERVRDHPADQGLRTGLVAMLAFAGHWDRLLKQLEVLKRQEANPVLLVLDRLVDASRERAAVFQGTAEPRFVYEVEPGTPPRIRLEALKLIAQGDWTAANERLEAAAEAEPSLNGTISPRSASATDSAGTAIDLVLDPDDRLGPTLEVFAPGGYFWVPFDQVQYLEIPTPTRLLDLYWTPAQLALHDGQLGEVHLPALYPGTEALEDGALRLGLRTDWDDAHGPCLGRGRKLLLIGEQALDYRDLPVLKLDPPASGVSD